MANTTGKTVDQWQDEISASVSLLKEAAAAEASDHDRVMVVDQLSELIARWQAGSIGTSETYSAALEQCADELQEALRELYPEVAV